jgi:diguanylate cyclase (GGDEF)-like protein
MLEAIDQQQEALRALATVDPLTGIFNRRRFTEELDRELERSKRLGVTGALLSIDLDDFKDINDTYGHAAGDEVLVTVAGLLQAEMRSYSVVSRFGGDEFVILLPGADRESGLKVANRLLETLAATQVPVGSETVTVRMSIGVACYPDDGVTAAAVLRAADAAMYTSKRDGRGCASVAPGIAVRDAASPATL